MDMENDVPKYKKKSDSSKSNSGKRSKHKHDYEKIIVGGYGLFGWSWGKRCMICGRCDSYYSGYSVNDRDFLKIGTDVPGIAVSDWLSVEELRDKYPGTPIYEMVAFRECVPIEDEKTDADR